MWLEEMKKEKFECPICRRLKQHQYKKKIAWENASFLYMNNFEFLYITSFPPKPSPTPKIIIIIVNVIEIYVL